MQTVLVQSWATKCKIGAVFDQLTSEYCTTISAQYINQKLVPNGVKWTKDHAKQSRVRANRLAPKSAVPHASSRKTGQLQKFTPDSRKRIFWQMIYPIKAWIFSFYQLKQFQKIRYTLLPVFKTMNLKFQHFEAVFPATLSKLSRKFPTNLRPITTIPGCSI